MLNKRVIERMREIGKQKQRARRCQIGKGVVLYPVLASLVRNAAWVPVWEQC